MLIKISKESVLIPAMLLVLLVVCWIELDLYAPSFPQIMHYFNTNEQAIQWTLSLNFLGFFITSLFCGPLADSYGRRPVLLVGTFTFVLGSLLCVFAPNMQVLLWGRLIQGIGVSAPVTVCITVIADLYQGERQMRLMSLMNSIITIVMAMAPIAGVFLTETWGWRSNFSVIAAGSLIGMGIVWLFLPETLPKEQRRSFSMGQLLKSYWILLTHREFMLMTMSMSFIGASYFLYVGVAPLLFMEEMGVSIHQYAYYQGFVVGMFALTSFLIPTLMKHFDVIKLTKQSLVMCFVTCSGALVQGLFFKDAPIPITLWMGLYAVAAAVPCCVIFTQAMDLFPDLRGSASSLLQALRMLFMSITTSIMGLIYNGFWLPASILIFLLVAAAFPAGYVTTRRR